MTPVVLVVTVTTAGTQVQVNSGTFLKATRAIIQGKHDNTGKIFVGGSDVSADTGISLDAKASMSIDPNNMGPNRYFDLSKIWIDSSVNGEKAVILYYTE